jgi:hypothetical protein
MPNNFLFAPASPIVPTIRVPSKRGERTLFRCAPFQDVATPPASAPAVAVFLEICMSIRCIHILGGHLLALACAQPTSQYAAFPSQLLTLQLAFGKICFESPHHQRLLRRLINLCPNGQAPKCQLFRCSFLNIFNLLSFGIIGDGETCPSPESYRMPQWTLNCQNCKKIFRHSKIDRQSDILLYDPLWPYRPELPELGVNLPCPHCHESATYLRFQLVYSPE